MDIYLYSHHLFAWNCVDIVRRNYVLVTNEVVWFGWKYTPSMQFPAWGFSNTISMILFLTSPASDGADSCMARLVRRSFHGTENVENTISQLKREILVLSTWYGLGLQNCDREGKVHEMLVFYKFSRLEHRWYSFILPEGSVCFKHVPCKGQIIQRLFQSGCFIGRLLDEHGPGV